MKLEVLRFSSGKDSTSGILFNCTKGREFLCYTLEDQYQTKKIMQETRIPAGKYEIKYRKEGGFNKRYSERYPDIHRGMLHVTNVPNFKWILIHVGNTDEHTAGCLLLGDTQENNQIKTDGFIGKSSQAYVRIYDKIASVLDMGEKVTITYYDFDVPNKRNK
tara:strand:- start:855 stop:1340 length:486 start_codon:yes stop_codon:yes gene_type:complete